ncbi:MAG: tetratricopeptide repeat protein [Deltaproteobacteria bacterium]|nr:tetratricopeptide repeat protein [Deltaproteobacteria bacterium]
MRGQRFRIPLVVFAVFVALFFSTVPGTGSAFRNVKEGAPAIAFSLKDYEGKDFEFKPDSGKITVLSFVKLAQERSLDQIKDLVALQEELGAKGVDFIVVSAYTDTPEDAKKVAAGTAIKFPILMDKDQKVYGDYGLFILPSTGVIGKDGKFAFEHSSHGRDFKDVVGGKIKVLAGLMSEDDYKKLITPVETVQKSKEGSEADRQVALGRVLFKKRMIDKAAEKFAKAVELDPQNAEARIAYGDSLVAMKKYDEALVHFQKAKELSPMNKDAQIGVGIVHMEKGEHDKAIQEISGAAMLNPKPEKAYFWLGLAYEKKGDLPNAVKYLRKAVEKFIKE